MHRKQDRGPKQTVLRALSKIRLDDGQALLKSNAQQRFGGAIYIAGYGVECALKARICAFRNEDELHKDFFHHDLRRLAEATDKWLEIKASPERQERLAYLESTWMVTMRYEGKSYSKNDVREFIERASGFVTWLLRS